MAKVTLIQFQSQTVMYRKSNVHKKAGGFTLIESLVALVILSTIFAVTWEWFGVAATATKKIERNLILPDAFESFLTHLSQQKLEEVKEGSYSQRGLEFAWKASIKRISTEEYIRRQPAWVVALFTIEVKVIAENESQMTNFSFDYLHQWRDKNYIDDRFFPNES